MKCYMRTYVLVCECIMIVCVCIAVSLGCLHDDVRAEPGSWLVVGMIPVFDKRKALQTGNRTDTGANGAPRRRVSLHHQCLEALLEGWNALTEKNKIMQWADGLFRRTCIMICAFFTDQPEADTYCCDTSLSCKLCTCPKHRLHEPVEHPPRNAHTVQAKVHRVADGTHTGKALFKRRGTVWTPTAHCSKAAHERERKLLNGTHIMHNSLWGVRGVDVQHMVQCMCMYLYVCVCIHAICDRIHVICGCICMFQCNSWNDRCTRTPCTPTTTASLCISSTLS